MNDLFRAAAESMLNTLGSDGILAVSARVSEPVRVSPLFPAKIARENSPEGALAERANVIISGMRTRPEPFRMRLSARNAVWSILSATEIADGVFELELELER